MPYNQVDDYKLELPELLDPALTDGYKNGEMMKRMPNYANVQMLEDIENNSYCFDFVFGENYVCDCEEAQGVLEEQYHPVPLKDVKKGDVITYYEETDRWWANATHFGFVESTDGTPEGMRIKSKWGRWGIFYHDLKSVPQCYGDFVVFWRKRP